MGPAILEILKVFAPLGGVILGGIITWRSGLRSRALERRQEARAALVGAIEESISATTAFRDDLTRWQAGGWGRPETHSDPRISALTAQAGAFSKAMSEGRGRVASALARLLVVADTRENLSEATALAEAVLLYGVPGMAREAELVSTARALRERTRRLAEGWRYDPKRLPARPGELALESAESRSARRALPTAAPQDQEHEQGPRST